jgi:transcriptional regulator with GAF, ATPase, and Fis domain
LQESELFGHEKGAFTGACDTYRGRFEQASGGTLFLDEVGEMHPSTQVKLLRVLQERVFRRVGGTRDLQTDVRIISATNRDLEVEVRAGRFRTDLFFRLVAYPLHVPSLRMRCEDIPLLAGHFLRKACVEMNRKDVRLSPDALDNLVLHEWPGNVRELENVIRRALLSARGSEVRTMDLPESLRSPPPPGGAPAALVEARPPRLPVMPLRELERLAIAQALERAGGNVDAAARQLGIGRATIYRRLARDPASGSAEVKP